MCTDDHYSACCFLKCCFTSCNSTCLSVCVSALPLSLWASSAHTPTLYIPTNERGAHAVVDDIIFVRHMPIYGSEIHEFSNFIVSVTHSNRNQGSGFSHSPRCHDSAFCLSLETMADSEISPTVVWMSRFYNVKMPILTLKQTIKVIYKCTKFA